MNDENYCKVCKHELDTWGDCSACDIREPLEKRIAELERQEVRQDEDLIRLMRERDEARKEIISYHNTEAGGRCSCPLCVKWRALDEEVSDE
jgi:hypothetical protein